MYLHNNACVYCTCTVEPIPFKAFITCAVETAICISAVGIEMAWICVQLTLVDICRLNKWMMTKHVCTLWRLKEPCRYITFSSLISRKYYKLTCAVDSISLETRIAGTMKATKGVAASGIFMTVVQLSCTLINVY